MRLAKRIRFSFLSGTLGPLVSSQVPQRGTLPLLSAVSRSRDKRAVPPTMDVVPR
jgi:hypothetical protein